MASNALVSLFGANGQKYFHTIISHGVEPTYIGSKRLLLIIEVAEAAVRLVCLQTIKLLPHAGSLVLYSISICFQQQITRT